MQPTEMFVREPGRRGKNESDFVSRKHIVGNRNTSEGKIHQFQAMLHGMIRSYTGSRELTALKRSFCLRTAEIPPDDDLRLAKSSKCDGL